MQISNVQSMRALRQYAQRLAEPHMLHLPQMTVVLFSLFVLLTGIPIVDVPLLGLSATAPIFFLIAVDIYSRFRARNFRLFSRWVILVYFFFLGLILSLFGNLLLNAQVIATSDLLTLIRYGYWLLVFFTTLVIIATTSLATRVALLLGVCAILVGLLRILDVILYGTLGSDPKLMSQNGFGSVFSTWTVYALYLVLTTKSLRWRFVFFVGTVILFITILFNLSRGAWVGSSVSVGVFVVLYVLTQHVKAYRVVLLVAAGILITAGSISFLPPTVRLFIDEHLYTFQALEDDSSYVTRELMVQKAGRIFVENPFFGAGIGRFRLTSVDLVLPPRLAGKTADFNRISSHNSYAALVSETGLFGTVPFAILLATLGFSGLRTALIMSRRGETWGLAMFASFVGISVHLWSLSGLTNTSTWFVYGLIAGMIQREALRKQASIAKSSVVLSEPPF